MTFLNSLILLQMDRLQLTAVYCNRRGCVNTTPQITYFLGAKRMHKITTGKSYDELLQHDKKMRIWTRSENFRKVENLWLSDKAQRECQKHLCLRDTPRYERQ